MAVPRLIGRNQTRSPLLSAISGPSGLGLPLGENGASRISPRAVRRERLSIVTTGAWRSGRERKRSTSAGGKFGSTMPLSLPRPGGGRSATVNENAPPLPPWTSRPVWTVTCSPGVNGAAGTKLAPSPSPCSRSSPACGPLCEPVTVIAPSDAAGAPRNEICVSGRATSVPGIGNALTLVVVTCAPLRATRLNTTSSRTTTAATAIGQTRPTPSSSAFARCPSKHVNRRELRSVHPRDTHVDPVTAERYPFGLEQGALAGGWWVAIVPSARTMRCQGTSGSSQPARTVPAKRGAPGDTSP